MRFGYLPSKPAEENSDLDKKIVRHSAIFAGAITLLLWLAKLLELALRQNFTSGGIYPRAGFGASGILTSPFIHADFGHLISNTVPFFLLLFALVYYYRKFAYRILWMIYLFAGISVWLLGREAWHIGASGIVYGLAAFHFTSGLLRNDARLLTISVVVAFLYGGLIWGLFPLQPEVSWESHFFGAFAGVILAIWYRKYRITRIPFDWEAEEGDDDITDESPEIEENVREENTHPEE